MVGTTREAAATESGGDEIEDETAGPGDETGDETAATAVVTNETAATGGVMYTDVGEMAALEGQRLLAELFPDSMYVPDCEGFHASEPAGNLSGGDDSESEAVTESDDDDGITGRLSDVAAAAEYRTNPNLPD